MVGFLSFKIATDTASRSKSRPLQNGLGVIRRHGLRAVCKRLADKSEVVNDPDMELVSSGLDPLHEIRAVFGNRSVEVEIQPVCAAGRQLA